MIPSNSENQQAAWLFEEWATSKLTNVLTGVKTSAATRASSWAFQPMTAGFPADFTTAVSESLKIASPDNIYYEHMEEIVLKQNEALHAIYLGTSVQTAIANLQAAAEQIMTANPPSTGA
jgi:ABC-type glycerol-3-phosphate transport system substrate-binding protein